jgi:hypothetical protein
MRQKLPDREDEPESDEQRFYRRQQRQQQRQQNDANGSIEWDKFLKGVQFEMTTVGLERQWIEALALGTQSTRATIRHWMGKGRWLESALDLSSIESEYEQACEWLKRLHERKPSNEPHVQPPGHCLHHLPEYRRKQKYEHEEPDEMQVLEWHLAPSTNRPPSYRGFGENGRRNSKRAAQQTGVEWEGPPPGDRPPTCRRFAFGTLDRS